MAAALTPEEVERGYNNRAAVPDHPRWLAHYPEGVGGGARGARAEARPALRAGAEGDARSLPARGTRQGDVRVLARRVLAGARQERFFVRRAAVRGAGPRGRGRQLRPLSRRFDRDDRRREPARDRVARARRRGARREPRAASSPADIRRAATSSPMLFTTDWAAHGSRARSDRRPASRCRASTISRRWCSSRSTPISSSTTPKPRGCRRRISRRGRARRSCSRPAPTRHPNSSGRPAVSGTPGPQNRPAGAHAPMLIRDRNHFDVVVDLADADERSDARDAGAFRGRQRMKTRFRRIAPQPPGRDRSARARRRRTRGSPRTRPRRAGARRRAAHRPRAVRRRRARHRACRRPQGPRGDAHPDPLRDGHEHGRHRRRHVRRGRDAGEAARRSSSRPIGTKSSATSRRGRKSPSGARSTITRRCSGPSSA